MFNGEVGGNLQLEQTNVCALNVLRAVRVNSATLASMTWDSERYASHFRVRSRECKPDSRPRLARPPPPQPGRHPGAPTPPPARRPGSPAAPRPRPAGAAAPGKPGAGGAGGPASAVVLAHHSSTELPRYGTATSSTRTSTSPAAESRFA